MNTFKNILITLLLIFSLSTLLLTTMDLVAEYKVEKAMQELYELNQTK